MKHSRQQIGGIVMMLPTIRKIQIRRAGTVIGSIYRWRGRLTVRGTIKTVPGDIAKIHHTNGSIEFAPQKTQHKTP